MVGRTDIEEVIIRLATPYQRRGRSVTGATTLNRELGIEGDDAVEFLNDVASATGTSLKSEFDYDAYFADEVPFSYREIIRLLKGEKRKSLTVRELANQFEVR